MISLFILFCVLITLVVLFTLRTPDHPTVAEPLLFLSCSRPSERKELGCWLFTISIWNRGGDIVTIERMEVVLSSGRVISVMPPPQDHPRAAVFHHILHFPITLPPATSVIVIASAAPEPMEVLSIPEQCRLRVFSGGTSTEYPLFRTSFS